MQFYFYVFVLPNKDCASCVLGCNSRYIEKKDENEIVVELLVLLAKL